MAPLRVEGLAPATTYHLRVVAKNPEKVEGVETTFTTHVLPQAFGNCVNDVFRIGGLAPAGDPSALLPDCRAYEQASPVEKNGVDARGRFTWARASLDGDGIIYGATSGIPGAEGSQDLPFYLASRGGEGWSTQGLLPPPSAGQNVAMLGWSPDFSQGFSAADNKVGPLDNIAVLSRSSAGGSLKEIVPYGSGLEVSPRLGDSSADGSMVLFESSTKLRPAAIAGVPNVYLWNRSDGKLSLASALNSSSPEGESPPEGAFAGSYDWIAGTKRSALHRGGAAASYYTQDEHTLTDSGSAIFTAAGTGQLYMRVNPGQPQSALDGQGKCTEAAVKACTLHVSETRRTEGKGEDGVDAAGTQPAAFLGAAADGSSVLFTSSEKLTNDATTGPEPPPAALGSANILDGSGKNLELCLTKAKGVAADGSHLYWANPGAGTISRAGPACESPEPIIQGVDNPQYVAVGGEHIYWTAAADGTKESGTIGRAKLVAGGAIEIDEDYVEGATNPQGIAVDAEHLYWANAGDEGATQTIGRGKLGAGEAEEVTQSFMAVGEGSLELIPQGVAVDATHIYWTSNRTGEAGFVKRRDLDGNPGSEIFIGSNGGPGFRGITLDAGHVYWAQQGADTIGRATLNLEATSAEREEFIAEAGHPQGLAADATHLYWSVNGETPVNPGNDLYRYEPGAATADQLSDLTVDTASPDGAEVMGVVGASEDAKRVYFVANGVLAAGAQAGGCKGAAESSLSFSGQCNLYLAEEGGPTRFVARLDASGGGDRSDARDWLPKGELSGQIEKTARVSVDGSTVLFRSQRKLTTYDNKGVPEFYRYRIGDAEPTCISCNPTGEPPVGTPEFGNISFSTVIPGDPAFVLSRNLSADGTRVFFQAVDPLVATDTNGADGCEEEGTQNYHFPSCQDVYEWEAQGTGSCTENVQGGGCLYLLSTGMSARASFLLDASPNGDDTFLATSSPNLVRQDQDQLFDVYDVRVQGGLSAQNQLPPQVCESGESCRPAATPAPGVQAAATATFAGPGNQKSACPPGKRAVRKKGRRRCVARHPKRSQGQHKDKRAARQVEGGNR